MIVCQKIYQIYQHGQMQKSDVKSLLINLEVLPTSSSKKTLPTLTHAVGVFKESLEKMYEVKSRNKVLKRQFQKQRSTTFNAKKFIEHTSIVKNSVDLDKYIKKWHEASKQKSLDQQASSVSKAKRQTQKGIQKNRNSLFHDRVGRYEQSKQQRIQNEDLIEQINAENLQNRIKNRKKIQRQQKKRLKRISQFNEIKQQQIKKQKQLQIMKYFRNSHNNKRFIQEILSYNYSLKNKKFKQLERSRKFNSNQLPINLASTIKNPQTLNF